MFEAPIIFD